MNKLDKKIVDRWYNTLEDTEKFLDFMQRLNVNECTVENGERVIYFEDGINYIAHGERIGEFDGEKEKAIIDMYAECGGEYE